MWRKSASGARSTRVGRCWSASLMIETEHRSLSEFGDSTVAVIRPMPPISSSLVLEQKMNYNFFSQWLSCACCDPAARGLLHFRRCKCRVPVQQSRSARCRASRAQESRMPATPTGHRQDEDSMETLDELKARLTQRASPAGEVNPLLACSQHLQDQKPMPVLTDEIRTFIVKSWPASSPPARWSMP